MNKIRNAAKAFADWFSQSAKSNGYYYPVITPDWDRVSYKVRIQNSPVVTGYTSVTVETKPSTSTCSYSLLGSESFGPIPEGGDLLGVITELIRAARRGDHDVNMASIYVELDGFEVIFSNTEKHNCLGLLNAAIHATSFANKS